LEAVTISRTVAIKSVKQNYCPSDERLNLLEQFRLIVNDCIAIGLRENVSTLKSLSLRAYHELSRYGIPSYYKLCAISRASGILASRKRSLKRDTHKKSVRRKATTHVLLWLQDQEWVSPHASWQ